MMAFLSCGLNQQATGPENDGSATEVIAGNLVNEDGSSAVSTTVYLRPADYLATISAKVSARKALKTLDSTFTDSLGNFAFDSISAGTYALECLVPETDKGVLIDSVTVTDLDSTTELPADTLKALGSISGQIQIPDSANLSQIRVLVYGLNRIAIPDSTGAFSIPGLPEGNYQFRVVTPDTFVDLKGDRSAQVTAGDTTILPASFLLFPAVVGKAYYVSPTGSDSAAGNEGAPFLTIQKSVNVARAGDTVYVKNGTYGDPIVLQYSGQPNAPIVFRNYPGHAPVVRFTDSTAVGSRIAFISIDGVTKPIGWIHLEGFEITNGWQGIGLYNAHDVEIRNNNIHHMVRYGSGGNGTRILFDGNIVAHNGRFAECGSSDPSVCNQDHGVGFVGTHIQITNNLIYDNLAYGISVTGYPYDAANHAGPEFAGAKFWIVANNTIAYNQYRAGIVVWNLGATDDRFENNILYENGQALALGATQGIDFYDCGANHIVRNNLFYASTPGGTAAISDTRVSGSSFTEFGNLFDTDPLLVDPTADNFQLQSGSPAIDAGLNLFSAGVIADFVGTARPKGAGFDIGAYEY